MRAHLLYGDGVEPHVIVSGTKIAVECVVVTPPSASDQTVWVDMNLDQARSLRRSLSAAIGLGSQVIP